MNITLTEYANANNVSVSKNGFSCPHCETNWEEDEVVSTTPTEYYIGNNGSGYEWYQINKCNMCGKEYAIHNGC